MNHIKKYEKIQSEWLEKNPKFYLSGDKDIKEYIDKYNSISEPDHYFDNKKIEDLKIFKDKERDGYYYIDNDNYSFKYYPDENKVMLTSSVYNSYKPIISIFKFFNKNEITFENVRKEILNDLFVHLNHYGVYHNLGFGKRLYITDSRDKAISKIKFLKENKIKILYFNNKNKKEFTDFEVLKINKLKNYFKNIKLDDIYFTVSNRGYSVHIKDKKLDDYFQEFVGNDYFQKEHMSSYDSKFNFGKLKNRYHTNGLRNYFRGIGLGYKIYKQFVKFQGYITSNKQISVMAKNIYRKLLNDEDIYHVIDKDNQSIILIYKDYKNISKLLKLIRVYELKEGLNFKYDKKLYKK